MMAQHLALTEIIPPPKHPQETKLESDVAWHEIEDKIGTALPNDYKLYIATYGSGMLADFIIPFNPFAESANYNLIDRQEIADHYRDVRAQYGDERVPYPLYPDADGLLPWADTANGNYLFWLTVGKPDAWPVVAKISRGNRFERHDLSMSDFLFQYLSGRIESHVLPPMNLSDIVLFTPLPTS